MASSLQKQLTSLKLAENLQQRDLRDNERPSILFDHKTAASISLAKIRQMALEGYMVMIKIVPEIAEFKRFLFEDDSSYNIDREKVNPEENVHIKQTVMKLLVLLSQHLTNTNAMRIIEYLLRNFEIHKFESEELIVLFMHFHSTGSYVKLLQNINLNNKYKWYMVLEDSVKQGKSFDRDFIIKKILKTNIHLLDQLLDFNLRYTANRSAMSSNGSAEKKGQTLFYVTKTVETTGHTTDSLSFRFLCVLVAELIEAYSGKMDLQVAAKKVFWTLISAVSDDKHLAFIDGCLLIGALLYKRGLLSTKELRMVLDDLLKVQLVSSNDKKNIFKFLFLCCSDKNFKITSRLSQHLNDQSIEVIKDISKYHSNYDLCTSYISYLISKQKKATALDLNELNFIKEMLVCLYERDQIFRNSKPLTANLLEKLATLFVHLFTQETNISSNSLLDTLVDLKQIIIFDITLFLEKLFSAFEGIIANSYAQSSNTKRTYSIFKSNIKKVFGEIMIYGFFDDLEFDSFGQSRINSVLNIHHLDKQRKLRLLQTLEQQFLQNSVSLKLIEKEQLILKFRSFFESENDLEAAMGYWRFLKALGLPINELQELNTKLLYKILQAGYTDFDPEEDQRFIQVFSQPTKNSFQVLFKVLAQILSKEHSHTQVLQFVSSNIDHFLKIEYNQLLELLRYFANWSESDRHLPQLIFKVIENVLLMEAPMNGSPESFSKISVCLQYIKIYQLFPHSHHQSDKIYNFYEKILAKLTSRSFMKEGLQLESWSLILNVLSEISELKVPFGAQPFFNSESNVLNLIEYFIIQNWSSLQVKDLRVLNQISQCYSQLNIKNWNRVYELISLLFLKFLHWVSSNATLDERLNLVLVSLKHFVKTYCAHFEQKTQKKSKKGLFLKKMISILLENSHIGSLADNSSFIKKLKAFFVKSLDKSAIIMAESQKFFEMFCLKSLESYFSSPLGQGLHENLLWTLCSILKDLDFEFSQKYIDHFKTNYYSAGKMSSLGSLICQFYLKNNSYEDFLLVLDMEISRGNSANLFKALKSYLSQTQDFAKVITLFKIWKGSFFFDLGDIKFSTTEFLYFIAALHMDVLNFGNKAESLNYRSVATELAFLFSTSECNTADIESIFMIIYLNLKALKRLTDIKDFTGYTQYIDLIFKTIEICIEALTKNRNKFSLVAENMAKSKKNTDDDLDEDPRKLGIMTVVERLGSKLMFDIDFDFYNGKGQHTSINSVAFILSHIPAITEFSKLLIEHSIIRNKPQPTMDIFNEDTDDNSNAKEEHIITTSIKSSTELLLFFMKSQSKESFKGITSLLNNTFDTMSQRRKKLITASQQANVFELAQLSRVLNDIFKINLQIIDRICKMAVLNQTEKLFILLRELFEADEKANDGSLLQLLDVVQGTKKIFYQLQLNYHDKFNQTIFILTSVAKSLSKPDHKTVLLNALIIHCLTVQKIPDYLKVIHFLYEFITYTHFTTEGSMVPLSKMTFSQEVIALLADFYKISYIIQQPTSELSDMFSKETKEISRYIINYSDKQNTAFSTDSLTIIINLLSLEILKKKQFVQGLSEISSSSYEDHHGHPEDNPYDIFKANISQFLCFFNLNCKEVEKKCKQQKSSRSGFIEGLNQTNQSIKKVLTKTVPLEHVIQIIPDTLKRFGTKQTLPYLLAFLLDIIHKKLESVTISKTHKKILEVSMIALIQNISDNKLLVSDSKISNKFLQAFLRIANQLFRKIPSLTYDIFANKTSFLNQVFDIAQRCGFIKVQLELFTFVSNFSKISNNDSFLSIFNELNETMINKISSLVSSGHINGLKSLGIHNKDGASVQFEGNPELLFEKLIQFYTNLIEHVGNFFEPYLSKSIYVLFSFMDTYDGIPQYHLMNLLNIIASHIEFRIALPHISKLIDLNKTQFSVLLYEVISSFTSKAIMGLDYDTFVEKHDQIFKILIKGLESLFNLSTQDIEQKGMSTFWVETFTSFSLKCNENQLKQYFDKLKKWVIAEKAPETSNLKKMMLVNIFNNIVEKLGSLVIYLYGDLFDFLLSTFQDIVSDSSSESKKLTKRIHNENQTRIMVHLNRLLLHAFGLLETSDKIGFIDSFKFEKLTKSFVMFVENFRFGMDRKELFKYFDENFHPTLVSLVNLVNDDYKTKVIVSEMLKFVRHPDALTRFLAVHAVKKIIVSQNEAFLTVVNDVLPKLSDVLDDPDMEVAQVGKEIIAVLENLTGENINEYLKNADLNFGE